MLFLFSPFTRRKESATLETSAMLQQQGHLSSLDLARTKRNGADFMDVDAEQDRLTDSDSGIDDCVQVQDDHPTPKRSSRVPQVVITNRVTRSTNGISKKRSRHSDPGPIHRAHFDTTNDQRGKKRRRQTLPATLNNDKQEQQETTVVRFFPLSAKLNARTVRRLKRYNLSAEMNMIEEEDRKERRRRDRELEILRQEIQELKSKEDESRKMIRMGRMSNVEDAHRIEELQMEIERLRSSMIAPSTTVVDEDDVGMAGYNYDSDSPEPLCFGDDYAASNDGSVEDEGDATVMHVQYAKRVQDDEGVSFSQEIPSSQPSAALDEERALRMQAQERLEQLEQDFISLQREYDEARDKISSLETSLENQEKEREILEAENFAELDDKDMQLIQKQATIDDLNEHLAASVEAQARRSQALKKLEQQAEELAKIIGKLEESHQQLQAEKEQLAKLLCDEQARSKALVENLSAQDAKLAELKDQMTAQDSEVESLRVQLEEARRALKNSEEDRESQGQQLHAIIAGIESRLADAVQARYDVERDLTEKIKEKKATIKSVREELLLSERECRETKEVLHSTQVELEVTQRASQQLQEQLAQKIKSEARLKRGIEKQMRKFSEGMFSVMQGGGKRRSDSGIGINEVDEEAAEAV